MKRHAALWGVLRCACRLRAELEAQLVEEELAKRLDAYVEARVASVMQSEAVQRELRSRLERERQAIEEQVRPRAATR